MSSSSFGRTCFSMLAAAVLLGGCSSIASTEDAALSVDGIGTPASREIRMASTHFRDGSYGNAQKHFRIAVEKEPNNPDAWLGLAASYDQLKRFDLADKAYKNLRRLAGDTPEVLNNIGYSYLLRGELGQARRYLNSAYNGDPQDQRIISNIETLNKMLIKKGQEPIPV